MALPISTGPISTGPISTGPINTGPPNTPRDWRSLQTEWELKALSAEPSPDFSEYWLSALAAERCLPPLPSSAPSQLQAQWGHEIATAAEIWASVKGNSAIELTADAAGDPATDPVTDPAGDPEWHALVRLTRMLGRRSCEALLCPPLNARFDWPGGRPGEPTLLRALWPVLDLVYTGAERGAHGQKPRPNTPLPDKKPQDRHTALAWDLIGSDPAMIPVWGPRARAEGPLGLKTLQALGLRGYVASGRAGVPVSPEWSLHFRKAHTRLQDLLREPMSYGAGVAFGLAAALRADPGVLGASGPDDPDWGGGIWQVINAAIDEADAAHQQRWPAQWPDAANRVSAGA